MDPLLILNKSVHENLDCKNKVICIFLDIQKAFDSVNHDILLKKLDYAGILNSYLDEITNLIFMSFTYTNIPFPLRNVFLIQ